MAGNKSLLLLPGDGIGPEVMSQVKRVIEWMDRRRAVRFEVSEDLVGGAAIDAHGVPLADATLEKALVVDAVLFGAVGGPKWDNLDFKIKPERGLLRLRKDLGLFANLRPAICFEALADASTLKREVVEGLDILIWVALWFPLDALFFDLQSYDINSGSYERASKMQLKIEPA